MLCACVCPRMSVAFLLPHLHPGTKEHPRDSAPAWQLQSEPSTEHSCTANWRVVSSTVKAVGEVTEGVHVGKAEQLEAPGVHHAWGTAVGSLPTTGF